jgi:hypothetical protein
MHPVLEQEGRDPRQGRDVVMRVGGVVQRIAQQRAEIVREAVRVNALALDQPGIAEGRLLAGLAPIDEHDLTAPLLQVQRDRHADDPGPQHDCIRTHTAHGSSNVFPDGENCGSGLATSPVQAGAASINPGAEAGP